MVTTIFIAQWCALTAVNSKPLRHGHLATRLNTGLHTSQIIVNTVVAQGMERDEPIETTTDNLRNLVGA